MTNPGAAPPPVLGRYTLVRLLARGGMGSVYLARVEGAAGFRKPVVVKVIHRHLMDDPGAVAAFVREAKLAVRLSHPNIVPVLDFGQHQGQYVMVLDYVHGHHLGVLCRYLRSTGRRVAAGHAGYAVYQVLRGLEAAHALADERGESLGLIHRDVSPQNILVSSDGEVRLTDFGIARVRNEATRSGRGDLKGKLAYLSPEQVAAGDVDQRADLFAVGIVLYEMLAGERLFLADSEAQTILKIHQGRVPDVRVARPDLPEEVSVVLGKALARDPDDRYPTAAAFAREVRTLLGGASPDEVEPSFRAMISGTFAEPDFTALAGELPDLARALDGPAVSLSGDDAVPRGRADGITHTMVAAPSPRARVGTVLAVVVGVALVAALVAGAVLFTLGGDRAAPGPSTPVAVIIEHRGGGGARPAATTMSGVEDAAVDAHEASVATSLDAGDEGPSPDQDGDAVSEAALARPARPGDAGPPRAGDRGRQPAAAEPLDGAVVSRMVMRQRGALERCFRSGGEGAGPSAASFTVRLEIRGDGSVAWAAVEPASLQATPAGACIAAVARGVRFPAHSAGALVFRVPITVEQRQAE